MLHCDGCALFISEEKSLLSGQKGGNVVGCPGAVYSLMLILLPEGAVLQGVDHILG